MADAGSINRPDRCRISRRISAPQEKFVLTSVVRLREGNYVLLCREFEKRWTRLVLYVCNESAATRTRLPGLSDD